MQQEHGSWKSSGSDAIQLKRIVVRLSVVAQPAGALFIHWPPNKSNEAPLLFSVFVSFSSFRLLVCCCPFVNGKTGNPAMSSARMIVRHKDAAPFVAHTPLARPCDVTKWAPPYHRRTGPFSGAKCFPWAVPVPNFSYFCPLHSQFFTLDSLVIPVWHSGQAARLCNLQNCYGAKPK